MFDDRLSLRKLEVFLAFLRTENIAKTAEDLGTAAVSVHRALHTLEETIQCPLFTRKGRQLQPLPTAREFAKYAQDLIARMHEAVEETRRVGGFEQKRMRLGSLYSLSVRTVPNLILGMKYRRPELEFELVMGSNKSLLAKLEENKLDAIVIATSGEEIDERKNIVIKLFDDDLFLAAPSDYKGRKKDVDLKDLHFAKWVTLQEVFATLDGEEGFCPAKKVDVKDTTGAGDAFFAGAVIGQTYGKTMMESCEIGTRLAASVITTGENVCPRYLPSEFGLDVSALDDAQLALEL